MSKYTPTHHAMERAKIRLGITTDQASEWFSNFMRKSKYVSSSGRFRMIYEKDGIQAVIDNRNNAIVTIHNELKIDFLQPVLEREVRKLRREGTRQMREAERRLSAMYEEMAVKMKNYANACHPETRDNIGKAIEGMQKSVLEILTDIERGEDEVRAKIKAIEVLAQ